MNDIISVIVPVYNTESYLRECIESLIEQTICNYEILLIDDGSEDNSKHICDQYSENYEFIRTFHKQNGGLSSARNLGLRKAKGNYIAFVDSDDIVVPDFLEKMYRNAICFNADIVQAAIFRIDVNGKKGRFIGKDKGITNGKVCLERLVEGQELGYSVVWNKLYRRELWEHIFFPKGRLHEDMYVNYKVYAKAQNVVLLPYGLYGYRLRPDSITMVMNQNDNLDFWEALKERERFLLEGGLTDIYYKHLRYKIAFVRQNYQFDKKICWHKQMLKDYIYDIYTLYRRGKNINWNAVSLILAVKSIFCNIGYGVNKLWNVGSKR